MKLKKTLVLINIFAINLICNQRANIDLFLLLSIRFGNLNCLMFKGELHFHTIKDQQALVLFSDQMKFNQFYQHMYLLCCWNNLLMVKLTFGL